jgi:FlaA1/EpsC-like NDP-sugar epimerase
VTHPDIIRYFMSIPEAAQLVLQAGLMGSGGEVFLLDMGKPVRIVDLARDMIRLSGMAEDEIEITYTGLRAGEKLYEELLGADEESVATSHPKLRIVRSVKPEAGILDSLVPWIRATRTLSDAETRTALARWVPGYRTTAGPRPEGAAAGREEAGATALLRAHEHPPALGS